jgi:hypothetical protein
LVLGFGRQQHQRGRDDVGVFAGHWCEVQLAENRRRIVVITHGGKNPFRMPFDRRIAKASK